MQSNWLANRQSRFVYRLGVILSVGLLLGLLLVPLGLLVGESKGALLVGLVVLGIGLLFGLRTEIQPAEIVIWSWKRAWWGGCLGLLIGFLCSIAIIILLSTSTTSLLLAGLAQGVVFGFGLVLSGGLSRSRLEKNTFVKPNEGIWRSARNSVRYGCLTGLISTPLLLLEGSLFAVIGVTLTVGLLSGGLACIQHLILRVLLWREKSTPWELSQFLDYAAERILLRKVGGGYIFVHRLLLDYFASLEHQSTI
jgi:hypothetical protein